MGTCTDCDRPAQKRGFCGRCYVRRHRAGTLPAKQPKPPCSVCGKPSNVKGYCTLHYNRQRTGKDPAVTPVRSLPDEERFWHYVDKSAGPDACWPWTGGIQSEGYGAFYWQGKKIGAHVLAYLLANGLEVMPENTPHVDHVRAKGCRMRHCCNPAHLEAVTQAENNRRAPVGSRVNNGRRVTLADMWARLWDKVDRSAGPDGCWPRLGYVDPAGVLRIWWNPGSRDVRRLIWEVDNGPVPAERSVHADSDRCVNPRHLYLAQRGRGNHPAKPLADL